MDGQEIEIKDEPVDWCGESTPGDETQKFSPDVVKTEAEGFDRLARSSYSAAINLAHRAMMSPKREEEGEEQRGEKGGFGFVDVDATQPSEQCPTLVADPLALSTWSGFYKRAILDGMKRAMLHDSSGPEPDGTTTESRVGDRGTNSTSSGCAFNSGSTTATRCGREDCVPERDNSARTATENKTSELDAECATAPQENAAEKVVESNFSPQAKVALANGTSDPRECTHDACGKKTESAPTRQVSRVPTSGARHECVRRDKKSGPIGHVRTRGTANARACDDGGKSFAPGSERPPDELARREERPHACDICEARFSRRYNLNEHNLTHTGQKRYTCDVCKRGFSKMSNLTRHKIIHTGVKPYACDLCEAKFYYKADFTIHERSHTGVKPYACEFCEARFSHCSSLVKHRRCHTGEKPYSCDLCGFKFSQQANLNKHIRWHSRDRKLLPCEMCHENFPTQQDLMIHKIMQKHH